MLRPHGTTAARPLRWGLGLATWKEAVVLFGARCSTYLQGWTWLGRSRECWPLSTISILREGSAAANLPAVTQAVVPPGVV